MAKKLFVKAKTEAGLNAAVNAGTLDAHVAFIEESGKEGIYAKGKTYQTVPSNGRDGQTLFSQDGRGVWADFDDIDMLSYGVEWKPDVADPVLTRVGNMSYHKTLPIQSGMKGCILNPVTKKVVYWLDEANWKYKKGGNPDKGETEALANLDGTDGEVFVYVPEFYIKSWDEPTRRCVRISPTKIDDTWEHQPALFMGAYKDTVLNTVPENMGYLSTLEADTAVSIANNATYCRGGINDSSRDTEEDIFKRELGKHRTNISRATFRTYTRKAGKEILSYRQYKNIIYWLYVIEYANFDCQAEYNPELTAEGYHQGGLGNGITNLTNGKEYHNFRPTSPNGYTNEFGNGTGIKLIAPLGPEPVGNVYATRWRGLENIFGDTWNNIDGIITDVDYTSKPDSKVYVYTTNDPTKYGDTSDDIPNMMLSGFEMFLNGYIKEFDLGTTAEIIPRVVIPPSQSSPTQYKCASHTIRIGSSTLKTLLIGGGGNSVRQAGLVKYHSTFSPTEVDEDTGFRSVSLV